MTASQVSASPRYDHSAISPAKIKEAKTDRYAHHLVNNNHVYDINRIIHAATAEGTNSHSITIELQVKVNT